MIRRSAQVGFGGGFGERDNGRAVWQRWHNGELGVDKYVHDTEVEFVVGVMVFTERGLRSDLALWQLV